MTSQVLKIKESGADVCNVSFYTDDGIVFANAMYANQVDLPYGIWSVGGGWQDSAFYESVSPEVYEYTFVQEDWDMSGVQNKEWIKEVAQQCKDTYGYEMSSFFAQGWTASLCRLLCARSRGYHGRGDPARRDRQPEHPEQRRGARAALRLQRHRL